MQGCRDGGISHIYYQVCHKEGEVGYKIGNTIRSGILVYNEVFDDNESCSWNHAISDNHTQMIGMMRIPLSND